MDRNIKQTNKFNLTLSQGIFSNIINIRLFGTMKRHNYVQIKEINRNLIQHPNEASFHLKQNKDKI